MHQMGTAADLDIALDRRLSKGVEEPACVVIQHQAIPFAPDDGDRRTDQGRVVGQPPMPRLDDLAEWTERNLDAHWIAQAAFRIAVEIVLAPCCEMNPRKNRWLVRRNVFDEPVPLIFR